MEYPKPEKDGKLTANNSLCLGFIFDCSILSLVIATKSDERENRIA